MNPPLNFDPKTTALVMIDLQNGIVSRPVAPHDGQAIVARCRQLAEKLRAAGGSAVYVNVLAHEVLSLESIDGVRQPGAPTAPHAASELVDDAGVQDGDILVTKRQWGAFYGTELDQQLRRRGIKTLIMAGIATNMGVESTARAAHDRGYNLIFAADAMSGLNTELHQFALERIFPMMGQVASSETILDVLA